MTWSISCSGSREEVLKSIAETKVPDDSSPAQVAQFEAAQLYLTAEVEARGEGSTCYVSASGHADPERSSLSFSVSTQAAAKPAAPNPE